MDFSFFLTDNKSGYKTRESWFIKNHSDVYDLIQDHAKKYGFLEKSFKERIWVYFHDITDQPKCLTCSKESQFSERFDRGYNSFCSLECANNNKEEMTNRVKKTINENWGVDYFSQHDSWTEKNKKTKLDRYGDENYVNIDKMRTTKLKKYGKSNYVNVEKIKQTCKEKYGVDSVFKNNDIKEKIKKTNLIKYGVNYPTSNKEIIEKVVQSRISKKFKKNELKGYDRLNKEYTIFCETCNSDYKISMPLLNLRIRREYPTCTNCVPINSNYSKGQEEIIEFIKSIGIDNVEKNNRTIISPLEMDIYLPDYKLGIEYHGIYWHSEYFRPDNYHYRKFESSLNNNITLLQIFEDEWKYKKDIVKSIILNKLGKINNRVYARNCEIREISDTKLSNDFLDKNHVQGKCPSSYKLGLFYNNELVSLMTFGNRSGVGNNKDKKYIELLRFCNKIDCVVVGAASKLFKFFTKKYNPNQIVSFSDNRLFNGNLYKNLGFEFIHRTKNNYWYVIDDMRYHRLNFKKSNLIKQGYDPNKSEREIMSEREIPRIYDSGVTRWDWVP